MEIGKAIVKALEQEGVDAVFGLPGGHVIQIYDALLDTPQVRHFLVRHEQTAASMAAGYAQLTGRPAVCLVTAGPGATNLITAVAEAYVGSLPMVILSGRGAMTTSFKGASQEVSTEKMFAPVTKWAVRVDTPGDVIPVLRRAFALARSGRPGPVYIDIPRDLLPMECDMPEPYVPVPLSGRLDAAPELLAKAAQALKSARSPIIVAGGGAIASGAFDEVRRLAEGLAVPVMTSLAGRGILSDEHPLSAGGLGTNRNDLTKRLLREADVVLGLGTRFEEMETNWRSGFVPDAGACYIQVDIDPSEISRSIPSAIGLVGDIKAVTGSLLNLLSAEGVLLEEGAFSSHPRTLDCTTELARINAELDEQATSLDSPMHPLHVIRTARRVFPKDSTTVLDVGCMAQHMAGAQPVFPVYEPRSLVVPSSFYGMGFSASAAAVGPIARPGKPALCFVGDGSIQMALAAFPVATQYKLPVTWVILNDQALGSIRDIQKYIYKGRYIATDFEYQPDFAKIAEGCGCFGLRVERPEDVERALRQALEANMAGRPAVLDFLVSPERAQGTLDHWPAYGFARD